MAIKKSKKAGWNIVVSARDTLGRPRKKRCSNFKGTKFEAQVLELRLKEEIKTSGSLKSDKELKVFNDLMKFYLENFSGSKSHLSRMKMIQKELGEFELDRFDERFKKWLNHYKEQLTCRKKLPSKTTINRIIEIVRACFNNAISLELIDKNPITKIKFPKSKEKPRDLYLDEEQRQKLLRAIKEHRPYLLPIVEYSLIIPSRKNELVYARRKHFNKMTQTIYIPDSKAGIPINKPIPSNMKEYFNNLPTNCEWLFYRYENYEYKNLGDFRKAWKFCTAKAGLYGLRFHDLRRCSATDLYNKGIPERRIGDIAGWLTPMLSTYWKKDSLKSAQEIALSGVI